MEVAKELKNVKDDLKELEKWLAKNCADRQNAAKTFEESICRVQDEFNAQMDSCDRTAKSILSRMRRLGTRFDSLSQVVSATIDGMRRPVCNTITSPDSKTLEPSLSGALT